MTNYKWLTALVVLTLIWSCSGPLTVEKRRYRPGYHIDWVARSDDRKVQADPAHPEIASTPVVVEDSPSDDVGAAGTTAKASAVPEIGAQSSSDQESAANADRTAARYQRTPNTLTLQAQETPQVDPGTAPFRTSRQGSIPSGWIVAFAGLYGLGLWMGRKRMLAYSRWATNNVRQTRWLLAGTHTAMGLGAAWLGTEAGHHGWEVEDSWWWTALGTGLLGLILYPLQRKRSRRNFFRWKMSDLLLVLGGLLGLFGLSNASVSTGESHTAIGKWAQSTLMHDLPAVDQSTWDWMLGRDADSSAPTNRPPDEPGEVLIKILLITLVLAAFTFLLALTVSLSCELSCSGQEGLAMVVLFGGGILEIVGAIALIRLIVRKNFYDTEPTAGSAGH